MNKEIMIFNLQPTIGRSPKDVSIDLFKIILDEAIAKNGSRIEVGVVAFTALSRVADDLGFTKPPVIIYDVGGHIITLKFNPKYYDKVVLDDKPIIELHYDETVFHLNLDLSKNV